jgi:tRNA-binding EMAP/Myf-like protein
VLPTLGTVLSIISPQTNSNKATAISQYHNNYHSMAVHQWMADYRVGVVESIDESGGKGTKALKICKVDIGAEDGNMITVVTSAQNVRAKSRLAVAPIGSTVLSPTGEGMLVTKTSVGGVMSGGIFCDAKMLAWDGGTEKVAAQIDPSVPVGAPPPLNKPRPQIEKVETALPESQVQGLFEKKLSKEEKKKLAEEKKKARKAAKEEMKDAA